MKRLKKILIKLLFPNIWLVIFLMPVAASMLVYAFAYPNSDPVIIYGSYFLSAYTTTIFCTKLPSVLRKLKCIREKNKYVNHYLTNPRFRVNISLFTSVAMNSAYAAMQLITGFFFRSVWFYALAAYYGLLAFIRISLLRYTRNEIPGQNRKRELYKYRACGILLLIMNQALTVIVFYIVRQNRGFEYHYIQTIAMAVYTFTSIIMATINIFKYRKYESPVISAAKAISLASASVSMLSLETAMITAFGTNDSPVFRQTITAITGLAVCTLILFIAIYMITHSTKELKLLKRSNKNGK